MPSGSIRMNRDNDTGYFGNKAKIAHMLKDTDLAVLRDRDDFRHFVALLAVVP